MCHVLTSPHIASQALLAVQDLIDATSHELFMPPGDVETLRVRVDQFLSAYTKLGRKADAAGDLLWACTPKFHLLWHLAHRAQYGQPRRSSCFVDEDLMKRIKEVCHSCASGTALHKMPGTVNVKYQWGTHLRHVRASKGE